MARKGIVKVTELADRAGLRFEYADGETAELLVADLSDDIVRSALLHGLKQKVCDSSAGKAESAADARLLHLATIQQITSGEWNRRAEGTGGPEVEALHRVTGKSLDECRAVVKGLDAKGKRALRKHPEIAAAMADIAAEKAKAAADGTDAATNLGDLFG